MDILKLTEELRDKYYPEMREDICRLFGSEDVKERGELASLLLTELPFRLMGDFHEAALAEKFPGKDGRARLAEDRKGHIAMSGAAIAGFYDEAAPKTADERLDYFKGISVVFPYMLTANHHRWLFEGREDAPDYREFMDGRLPESQARFWPMLENAYAAGGEALPEAYCAIAGEHPFALLRDYYLWLEKQGV